MHQLIYEVFRLYYHEEVLHQVSRSIIDHDITIFLRHEFDNITKEHFLEENWPGEEIIKKLVQKADRLFTYAATVCHFICESELPSQRTACPSSSGWRRCRLHHGAPWGGFSTFAPPIGSTEPDWVFPFRPTPWDGFCWKYARHL
jgi:hypothetical protein